MPRHPTESMEALDEEVVRTLGEALAPSELSTEQRLSMRTRIMSRLTEAPPPLTETIRTESIPWRTISPKVQAKVLKRDDAAGLIFVLWRLAPGGALSAHPHDEDEDEECLVLEGEMLVGTHCVHAGELHIARRGSNHPDLTTRTGALVLVRSAISPQLAQLFPG